MKYFYTNPSIPGFRQKSQIHGFRATFQVSDIFFVLCKIAEISEIYKNGTLRNFRKCPKCIDVCTFVFFDRFRILFPYGESHKNPEIESEGKSSILRNWWGGLRPPPKGAGAESARPLWFTNSSILKIFLRFRFLGSYGIRPRGRGF